MEKDVKILKMLLIVTILLIIVVIGVFIYLFFFRTIACDVNDEACFSSAIINCQRATFIRENEEFVTSYSILGKSESSCAVTVSILQVKKGSNDLSALEGKSMTCNVPGGLNIQNPEEDLKNCQGLLKEEIQNIIIQKMHAQLIQNMVQIKEDITATSQLVFEA
jgi:hypothetical protein